MKEITVNSIINRLKSETPKFWKQMRNLMITCGTIGGALIAVPAEYTTAVLKHLPDGLPGTLFTIGAVGTALASMTKIDAPK